MQAVFGASNGRRIPRIAPYHRPLLCTTIVTFFSGRIKRLFCSQASLFVNIPDHCTNQMICLGDGAIDDHEVH